MATNSDARRKSTSPSSEGSAPTIDAIDAAGSKTATGKTAETERKFLGKYKIEKILGSGGMGSVFLATDMELRRQVALKILPKDKAENPRLVKRFKSEAMAAAQLRHDNIVAVYEAGEADGQCYIALEFVDGQDAHQLVAKRGVIPVRRSIEIVTQIAQALQHAYEKKIVHRDIKPSNLLIRRDGVVKLADLGLARSVDETMETGITRAGTTVGTVDYMSPEQARDSKAADIRSDIYSLGCTWYHLLTGSCPYPDGALTNKLNAHASKPIPDPRTANSHVPDGVVAVLNRMMAKKPEDRYQTPAELVDDLSRATLNRENVSNSVLAALAQADSSVDIPARGRPSEFPAAKSYEPTPTAGKSKRRSAPEEDVEEDAPVLSRSSRKSSSDSTPSASVPSRIPEGDGKRKKRKLSDIESDNPSGPDMDGAKSWMKYLPIAGLVAFIVAVAGYAASYVGSALDGGGGGGRGQNPFATGNGSGETQASSGGTAEAPNPGGTSGGSSSTASSSGNSTGSNTASNNKSTGPDSTGTRTPINNTKPGTGKIDQGSGVPTVKVEIGREGERDQIPLWVGALPTVEDFAKKDKLGGLNSVTVGRDGDKPANHATLNDALTALPADGGVITLVGSGPFVLRPAFVSGKKRLVIAGSPGSQPVIILQPERTGLGDRVLRVSSMSLELIGVHLVAVARQFLDTEELSLIEVATGDVSIRQSSITVIGKRGTPVTALRVSGDAVRTERTPRNSARILLDRLFARGPELTLLTLSQNSTDLVASNCALASGAGPAIRVLETAPVIPPAGSAKPVVPAPRGDAGKSNVSRMLRIFSCSLSCPGPAFALPVKSGAASIPPTSLHVMNSIVAVNGDAKSPMLDAAGWPQTANASSDQSQIQDLEFNITSTVFAGWKNYVASDVEAARAVSGASSWVRAFSSEASPGQFSGRPWPSQPPAEFSAATPADLDPASIASTGVKSTSAGNPGAEITGFSLPPTELVARANAQAERPLLTSIVNPGGGAGPAVVTIDAAREDVGRIISAGQFADGATIRISGAGQRKTSPIVLKGKSALIEFAQEGALTLELDYKPGTDAFITATEGSVEVVGGRFRINASQQGSIPKWFLAVTNGSFSLDGCHVAGPMTNGPRFEGMIRWTRAGDAPVKPLPAGQYDRYGRLTNCYLASFGKFVIADMRGHGLSIQNTGAVALDDAFDLNIAGADNRIAGAVELRECTISTAGAEFFRIKAGQYSQPSESPLRFFVDRTAFVSAVDPGNNQLPRPYLVNYTGPLRDQKQAEWWGYENGFGSEIRQWLRGDNDPPAEGLEIAEGWIAPWGPGHELRPLTGKGAVVAAGGFKLRSKISPADLRVEPTSTASRWNTVGGPIGADVSPLDDGEGKGPSTPSSTPPKTTKPGVPRPNL